MQIEPVITRFVAATQNLAFSGKKGATPSLSVKPDSFESSFDLNSLLKKDKSGNLPIHTATTDETKSILDKIANNPDVLQKMLTTKNKSGVLPLNLAVKFHKMFGQKAELILDAAKSDSELLRKIVLANQNGENIFHQADAEMLKVIFQKLEGNEDIIADGLTYIGYRVGSPLVRTNEEETKLIIEKANDIISKLDPKRAQKLRDEVGLFIKK